jgi:hypothetical protein
MVHKIVINFLTVLLLSVQGYGQIMLSVDTTRGATPTDGGGPTPPDCDLTTKLFSYWDFEEGTGTTAEDELNRNDFTLYNTPTWVTGVAGNYAIDFNESQNEYASLGAIDTYQFDLDDSSYTVNFWLKSTDPENSSGNTTADPLSYVTGNGSNISEPFRFLYIVGSDDWDFGVSTYTGSSTYNSTLTTTTTIDDGNWHMITLIHKAPADSLFLYVDAILNASALRNGNTEAYLPGSNQQFDLSDPAFSNRHYHGSVDELGIWTEPLTQAQINRLWNGGIGRTYFTLCDEPIDVADSLFVMFNMDNTNSYYETIRGQDRGSELSVTKAQPGIDRDATLYASGSYTHVAAPLAAAMNFDIDTEDFTLAFWYKASNTSQTHGLTGTDDTNPVATDGWYLDLGMSTDAFFVRWQLNEGAYSSGVDLTGTDPGFFNDTDWHYILMEVIAPDSVYVYYDNSLLFSDQITITSYEPGGLDNWGIGAARGLQDTKGYIDQYAMWTRRLTQAERDQLYREGAGLPYVLWGGTPARQWDVVNRAATSGNNLTQACATTVGTDVLYWERTGGRPSVANSQIVYTNAALTTPFNGAKKRWKVTYNGVAEAWQIDTDGSMMGVETCP